MKRLGSSGLPIQFSSKVDVWHQNDQKQYTVLYLCEGGEEGRVCG